MFRVQEKPKKYHEVPTQSEEEAANKRPPGLYKCPECRDTTIIWRTAVDKYKVKCTKCSADMVRVTPMPAPVAVPVVVSSNKLDGLAEIYGKDPQRAQLEASRAGVPLCEVAFHYGKGTALTGLQLGVKHGQEEAAGTRGAPGALKLWLLQKLHGGSYVVGRQKGLSGQHGGTRSTVSIVDALPALLKGLVHGQTPT